MAIKRWLGSAAAVSDVWTVSLSGTVVSQTYTVTINAKNITFVAGSSDTVSTILVGLQAKLSAVSPVPPVEFTELTYAALPIGGPYTSLVMTAATAGNPVTVSVSTSGAATFTISNTTVATGPTFFSAATNWSDGAVPTNNDTFVFDSGSVPCSNGLNTGLTGCTTIVEPGYFGSIGRPFINSNNATTYAEYRTTSLTFPSGTSTASINSPSIQRCNLAFGTSTASVRILNTSMSRPDAGIPVVLISGGASTSELDITKGDVGLAFYQGTVATFPVVKTGYASNALTDVSLLIGKSATLTTITKNGGYMRLQSNVTTLTQGSSGGTVDFMDSVTATTVNAYEGSINVQTSGAIGTINAYDQATINFDLDPRAKTVTNPINVYSSSVTIKDSQKSVNSGTLSLNVNGATSVNVSHGANTTIVYT